MEHDVCPWWLGYLLASPLRRLIANPNQILRPYLGDGMVVFEPGPGMGFFTIEMARMVGPRGKVVAVDIQPQMLESLKRRCNRAGVADRIITRLADAKGMGIADFKGSIDFILAFAVVHELPDQRRFFGEAYSVLKPKGRMLFSEPANHVDAESFGKSVLLAEEAGLRVVDRPTIRSQETVLLEKNKDN